VLNEQVVAELTCEVRVSRWLDPADNKELSEPPEPGEYKLHVTSEPPRDDAGCCGGRWQRVTLSTAGGHDKYAFANPKGIAVQAKFGSPFTPPMPQLGKQMRLLSRLELISHRLTRAASSCYRLAATLVWHVLGTLSMALPLPWSLAMIPGYVLHFGRPFFLDSHTDNYAWALNRRLVDTYRYGVTRMLVAVGYIANTALVLLHVHVRRLEPRALDFDDLFWGSLRDVWAPSTEGGDVALACLVGWALVMFLLYTLNGLCTWFELKADLDSALLSLFYLDAKSKAMIEGADTSLQTFVERRQLNSTYPWSYPLLATVGAIVAFAIKVEYGHEKSVRCLADVSATDLFSEVVDGLGMSSSAAAAGLLASGNQEASSGPPSCPEPYHLQSKAGACCFIHDTTSWAAVRGFWASFFVGFATYYSSVSLIGRFMLHSGIHHDPESRDEKLAKPKHGPVVSWTVSAQVSSLCWTRDRLVACEPSGRVAVYEALTGTPQSAQKMLTSDGAAVSVPVLAVSPDGKHVATFDQKTETIAVWDLEDHLRDRRRHAPPLAAADQGELDA